MSFLGRDNLYLFTNKQIHDLGTHIHRVHNLAAALFYRTLLKIFTHTIEEHNAHSLLPGLNRKGAQSSHSHQKVFVKYIALQDILQSGNNDAST